LAQPPPKPTEFSGWQIPGGAEKNSSSEDGSKTYKYADGTTIVVSPPDPDAPFATDSPKTVTVTAPDKSKKVFKWQPTGKYVLNEFDAGGNAVPLEKKPEGGHENKGSGVLYSPSKSANASSCPCSTPASVIQR
jgi:hypothetical protein